MKQFNEFDYEKFNEEFDLDDVGEWENRDIVHNYDQVISGNPIISKIGNN